MFARFWLEQASGGMEALCGKADEDGGHECEAEADQEKEESDGLKVKTAETEKLWELPVEL